MKGNFYLGSKVYLSLLDQIKNLHLSKKNYILLIFIYVIWHYYVSMFTVDLHGATKVKIHTERYQYTTKCITDLGSHNSVSIITCS